MTLKERMQMFEKVTIYPVITESFCAGRVSLDVCKQVLDGGARIVQLREKDMCRKDLYALAEAYRKVTSDYGALFIMNDHLDIALSVEADGVHLGQDDFPVPAARRLAPELVIGVSTHNEEEAVRAEQEGASIINIGPVYSTQTKTNLIEALGPERIREIAAKIRLPFTVMGGIKQQHFKTLIEHGARHLAMVTEITQADQISDQVRKLQASVEVLKV